MPGWHEATKELQEQGKVQMVGIIQEQHPDRCRLFMQWKKMGWPILVDSLNTLEVTAVPLTYAIDEYGIIRDTRLRVSEAAEIEQAFLDQSYEDPGAAQAAEPAMPDFDNLKKQSQSGDAPALLRYADALTAWGGLDRLGEAIAAYHKVLEADPGYGPAHFRLGVALRKRYDSAERAPDDFQAAVSAWKQALDLDPNQYIWRRRIQQYGPRLDKPYPFYDWVPEAREAVAARGETPSPLTVEPGGAEFAAPLESFVEQASQREEPDPQGRINRDEEQFVHVETTVVPPTVKPGESVRVHVVFRPNEAIKAHWNNEADGLELWVNPPEGWQADRRLLGVANPPEAVSTEDRGVELELRCPEDAAKGPAVLSSYALYYVCEDVEGTCLYRRQDIELTLLVD